MNVWYASSPASMLTKDDHGLMIISALQARVISGTGQSKEIGTCFLFLLKITEIQEVDF